MGFPQEQRDLELSVITRCVSVKRGSTLYEIIPRNIIVITFTSIFFFY